MNQGLKPRFTSIPTGMGFSAWLALKPAVKTARLSLYRLTDPDKVLSSAHSAQQTAEAIQRIVAFLNGHSLGVMVPKRLVRRSVDRHCFKRLVRERFQKHLLASDTTQPQRVLVKLSAPIQGMSTADRLAWHQEIDQLFLKLSARP